MASRLLAYIDMHRPSDIGKKSFKPTVILFPASLLILTPIFDVVRAITGNSGWGLAAFWCAFAGMSLALVVFLPLAIDWLALERGTPARQARLPSLLLDALGLIACVASVALRLRARGALSLLAFMCADGGVTLLALAALTGQARARPVGARHTLAPQM
jgi:uncharacterized membrane protein